MLQFAFILFKIFASKQSEYKNEIFASREQWWLIGSSGGSLGSSGGSLVATPDCKLQSWVQIQQSPQPTVDCLSFDGLPSGMALCCRLSSEGRQRSIYKETPKTIKEKKIFASICSNSLQNICFKTKPIQKKKYICFNLL